MLRAGLWGARCAGLVRGRGSVMARCGIASTAVTGMKQMPPRPQPVNEDDIKEAFLKGSGPGGQKINKTSSAVQLKHLPTGIVVKVQATRSRQQNRKIAREMLAGRIEELEKGPKSRVAVVGEAKKKKKSSAVKKSKRKYKLLDAAKVETEVREAFSEDDHHDEDDEVNFQKRSGNETSVRV